MTILEEIKERLELVTLGELPYRDTDAEKIAMLLEQETILNGIEQATRNLRVRLIKARQDVEPQPLPKKKKPQKPIPAKAQEFFRRIKKGTDWGAPFKFRWLSEDGRFLIWTIPGGLVWNGIGMDRAYSPARHTLSDLSKMKPEPKMESGLFLSRDCVIREHKGRLTNRTLEDMIQSAERAAKERS